MGPLGDAQLTDLPAADRIAAGGQGTVFRLARPTGTLLKLYHREVAVLAGELRRLIDLPARAAVAARTAWPSGRVFDGGRCVGLLMPEAPARFTATIAGRRRLLELQYLLYPKRAMWAELRLPTEEERRRIAVGYLELFTALHRNGIVVGDVSMRNLLWTLDDGPDVFAIDCDGFRLAGRPPAVRTADTAGWLDPGGQREAGVDTDRYKIALLTLRLLLGDHRVTPEEVRVTPALRTRLGSALSVLAARAAVPGGRPAAECWLGALS